MSAGRPSTRARHATPRKAAAYVEGCRAHGLDPKAIELRPDGGIMVFLAMPGALAEAGPGIPADELARRIADMKL
jgi:hypothetical protein